MIKQQREGFEGQLLFRFTTEQIRQFKEDPLHGSLFVTDIGYYPHASKHFVDRPKGISSYILIHCIGGSGWFSVGGATYPVNDGEFFIISPDTPHQYGSRKGWRIYWAHVDGVMASEFMRRIVNDSFFPKCEPERALVVNLFRDILERLSAGPSIATLNYLHFSLWHLLGMYVLHDELSTVTAGGNLGIRKVINYMNEHVADQLTLNAMAQRAGLSVSRFSQLFREQTGYSPMDYHIRLKVQKAGQLLSATTLQIQEIAQQCGWSNPFYFSKIFKQVTGYPPKSYRKQYRI